MKKYCLGYTAFVIILLPHLGFAQLWNILLVAVLPFSFVPVLALQSFESVGKALSN